MYSRELKQADHGSGGQIQSLRPPAARSPPPRPRTAQAQPTSSARMPQPLAPPRPIIASTNQRQGNHGEHCRVPPYIENGATDLICGNGSTLSNIACCGCVYGIRLVPFLFVGIARAQRESIAVNTRKKKGRPTWMLSLSSSVRAILLVLIVCLFAFMSAGLICVGGAEHTVLAFSRF